jgi:hypothetical protein
VYRRGAESKKAVHVHRLLSIGLFSPEQKISPGGDDARP